MGIFSVLLIAVALAMDAFAVALAAGMGLCLVSRRQVFRLAWHFGFFQGAMTVLGWGAGLGIHAYVERFGTPLAAGLLVLVGGRMIYEALSDHPEQSRSQDPTRGKTLVILALATSIDAFAVGLSFAVLAEPVWLPALLIGVVAILFTIAGLRLGCLLSNTANLGRRAEIIGGLVLIAIAGRLLIQQGYLPFW